jgi:hypothetical protein
MAFRTAGKWADLPWKWFNNPMDVRQPILDCGRISPILEAIAERMVHGRSHMAVNLLAIHHLAIIWPRIFGARDDSTRHTRSDRPHGELSKWRPWNGNRSQGQYASQSPPPSIGNMIESPCAIYPKGCLWEINVPPHGAFPCNAVRSTKLGLHHVLHRLGRHADAL